MLDTLRATRAGLMAAVVLHLGAVPLAAQSIGGGLSLGVGFSELNSSDEPMNVRLELKGAPAAGVFAVAPIPRTNLSLRADALLVRKGTAWGQAAERSRIDAVFVEVPALVRYSGRLDTRYQLHVFAGPSVAWRVRTTYYPSRGAAARVDVGDRFRAVDAGWVAGIGLGVDRFVYDLRYGGSFSDVVSTRGIADIVGQATESSGVEYRHRLLLVLASYQF